MTKRITVYLPAYLLVAALLSTAAAQRTEITYAFWNAAQQPAIEAQVEAFEAQHPDIEVSLQVVPFNEYWTKLQTGVAGGAAFDVFWMNGPNFPVYASQGVLADLSPILGAGAVDLADYPQALVDLYTHGDTVYALPRDFDTIGLFYNKAHFDEAGLDYPDADWTWDDLRDAAERLTVRQGNRVARWGFAAFPTDQMGYFNLIPQNGGRVMNDDGSSVLLDEPASCEALLFLYDFQADGLAPGGPVLQAEGWNAAPNLFPSGRASMIMAGSWFAGRYSEADPNIDVAPLPRGRERATVVHGLGNAVWANSRNKEAALAFVEYLASREAEEILGETGTVIPAMNGLADVWLKSVPGMDLQVFIDALDYAVPIQSAETDRGAEWVGLANEVYREAWLGNVPRDRICEQMAAAANAALAR
jgi:multiple sugar transport system substrate-binding protein